jgi:hypothetical protein
MKGQRRSTSLRDDYQKDKDKDKDKGKGKGKGKARATTKANTVVLRFALG